MQLLFKIIKLLDIFINKSWTITNDYKWKKLKNCQMYDKCENKGTKYVLLKKISCPSVFLKKECRFKFLL